MPDDELRNPQVAELRIALESLGLSTKGQVKVLKERLRKAKKRTQDSAVETESNSSESAIESNASEATEEPVVAKKVQQPFDFYCVFDVEATCREDNVGWKHEVIEFPVVLVCGRTFETIAEFRSFVRPVLNPVLSDFCTQLTGITQDQVDTAPTFPEVLKLFEAFLSRYKVKHGRMRFITDGPWDIRDFVRNQCVYSDIRRPAYFDTYLDLRRIFTKFYGRKGGKRANLNGMLSLLNMEFEGRQHSGIDDTRNIAKIAVCLMEKGCVFDSTLR
ncbi:3'-5' exoribonuclease 1 [Chytriomyces hyalinus]|nr:3'-5' exoribonuclease 1 [Chytriomyces hyalinus]